MRSIREDSENTHQFISALKKVISQLVPSTFSWWIEIDDTYIGLRWIWNGHPTVSFVGRLQDSDTTILLALLAQVDWDQEIDLAIASVEEFERSALDAAQAKRKATLLNRTQALADIELPKIPPVTIEEKRSAYQNHKAKEISRTVHGRTYAPTPRELANDELHRHGYAKALPPTLKDELPEFGLSKSFAASPRQCTWQEFSGYDELMHELFKHPENTYKQMVAFGFLWRYNLIYTLGDWLLAHEELAGEVAQGMTCEEFRSALVDIKLRASEDVTDEE